MALERVRAAGWFKNHLKVFRHGSLFELLGCLRTVVLYKIVYDSLLEAQLDGYILAKDYLAFKNVLVSEDHLNS